MDLCKAEVTTVGGGMQIDGSLSERWHIPYKLKSVLKL